jgi:hypothetical protein
MKPSMGFSQCAVPITWGRISNKEAGVNVQTQTKAWMRGKHCGVLKSIILLSLLCGKHAIIFCLLNLTYSAKGLWWIICVHTIGGRKNLSFMPFNLELSSSSRCVGIQSINFSEELFVGDWLPFHFCFFSHVLQQ